MTASATTLQAPAKINLYLEVLGRRADGFHELLTVLQTVDLCDTVTIGVRPRDRAVPSGEADVTLEVAGDAELRRDVPVDERNLAVRAATRLLARSGHLERTGVDIALVKRIPSGGGLGGGSSDAAAVLVGLHRQLGAPLDARGLHDLATELGSDVPFFLTGGTALCAGRGERVTPIDAPRPFDVDLLLPDVRLPTPQVYAALDAPTLMEPSERRSGGEPAASRREDLVRALAGATVETLEALYRNDLEPAALRLAPSLRPLLEGTSNHLSGSGSTLFRLRPQGTIPTTECAFPSIRIVSVRSRNR